MASENIVIAHCGLVCSDCGAFRKGKCTGCYGEKPMFRNCPVKKCCLAGQRATCAECAEFPDLRQCRKLNNLISKLFGLVFRTNRIANLLRLRAVGPVEFRAEAAASRRP